MSQSPHRRGEVERLDGERGRAEHRTPSITRVSERGWGADATRAGAPSPDRQHSEGNADEDGLDEDGVIQVPQETWSRARILVSVEQDVRDPVAGQRGHQRRSEKQDAPASASYEHGRSIPFDASFLVRGSSLRSRAASGWPNGLRRETAFGRWNGAFRRIEYRPGHG